MSTNQYKKAIFATIFYTQQPTLNTILTRNYSLKMLKLVALVTLAVAFHASAAPAALNWNSIVGAKADLFAAEFNAIRSKSLNTAVLVAELNDVLGQTKILNSVYRNYLIQHKKDVSRFLNKETKAQLKKNLLEIAEHNLEAMQGNFRWTEGVNKFTDMTKEEYGRYLTYNMSFAQFYAKANITKVQAPRFDPAVKIPHTLSFRDDMTPVKDQGECGSCYAFAAIGQLEGHYALNNEGAQTDLSEQQLVDCSQIMGNNGCDGGGLGSTAEYLIGGIASEDDYPYEGAVGTCQDKPLADPVVLEHYDVTTPDEVSFYLFWGGPVVIGIDASCDAFMRYSSGVVPDCGSDLDHAVLATGVNSDGEPSEFEIKNSWGSGWGEGGYATIAINPDVPGIGTDGSQVQTN